MTHVITLIASDKSPALNDGIAAEVAAFFQADVQIQWLAVGRAFDVLMERSPADSVLSAIQSRADAYKLDVISQPLKHRRKKLLLADMDSTIVQQETLDELADEAGIKPQIAAITERAMRGELVFEEALRERVALLEGLEEASLERTLARMTLMPGAKALVQTLRAQGATCVLVSGGFTYFTGAIATQVGFQHQHGNVLEVVNGKLTGNVQEPILNQDSKLAYLKRYINELGIAPDETMAIGDGANDIPMLKAAGLGVGVHAKPLVVEAVSNQIRFGDLSALLYAQGYCERDIEK